MIDTNHQSGYEAKRRGSSPARWSPLMPRVLARITKDTKTGCWLDTKANKDGYARISYQGRPWLVHRAVYTELVGEIPQNLELDHYCENRNCCNPDHLEPVAPQVNTARGNSWAGVNQRKTHCKNGHEFTPENTHVGPRSMGRPGFQRWCIQCRRDYYRATYERQYEQKKARRKTNREQAA